MRNFIGALIFAALFTPIAAAQERTTYFLIDASGSMDGKIDAAEEKISRLIDRVTGAHQQALVSRTYFRAKTRQDCWKQVKISDAVPAAQSVRETITFTNDFTPLGAALEAAIIQAGNNPADIYLVTDEAQTAACGVDVCAVAAAYLPKTNVNVLSIPVGSKPADHDRLGCLEGAQGKPGIVPPLVAGVPAIGGTNKAGGRAGAGDRQAKDQPWVLIEEMVRFFEYWLWFIGFVFIAWWGVRFGYRHLDTSVHTESQTREIQVLRDKMAAGDDTAGPRFLKLVQDNKDAVASAEAKASARPWHRRITLHWAIVLGLLALLPLTLLPDGAHLGYWSFGRAKEAAWRVLDSDFATAFAAAWIAVVFFAGSQLQREAEANRNYELAATDAQQVRIAQENEDLKFAHSENANARAMVGGLDFGMDAPSTDDPLEVAIFKRVVEAAKLLAQRALPTDAKIKEIEQDTERLRNLAQGPTIMGVVVGRVRFGRFVERIVADPAVPTGNLDWSGLAKVFADAEPSALTRKLKELDEGMTKAAGSKN